MRKVHEFLEIGALMLATAVRGDTPISTLRDFEKLDGDELGATVIHYLG